MQLTQQSWDQDPGFLPPVYAFIQVRIGWKQQSLMLAEATSRSCEAGKVPGVWWRLEDSVPALPLKSLITPLLRVHLGHCERLWLENCAAQF